MKIVLVFWVIAICWKDIATLPLSQGILPDTGQQAIKTNHVVVAPSTVQNGAPVSTAQRIVSQVNLPIVPAQITSVEKTINQHNLNNKQVQNDKPATGIKSEIKSGGVIIPTLTAATVPVTNIQNIQNVLTAQTLNNQNKVQEVLESKVVPIVPQHINNVQKSTLITTQLGPEKNKVLQLAAKKNIHDVHKPVQETIKISLPIVETQKLTTTRSGQSEIVQLNTVNTQKQQVHKVTHPVITEKSNNVLASVSTIQTKEHIQPVVVAQTKIAPSVSQAQVNTYSNQKEESAVYHSIENAKPVENVVVVKKVIQPQVTSGSASTSTSSLVPPQLPTIAPTFVTPTGSTQNKQTVLKINKMDPASITQAADYAAKAAVKAANEAIFSSVSASAAAHEANEAVLLAKDAAKAIKIAAAELASRTQVSKLPSSDDPNDVTLTFSEKDADKLADIVVAAINRALQSIKIPVSKSVSSKSSTVTKYNEFQDEPECLSDDEPDQSKTTKHTLVPKKSKLIPSHVHSFSKSTSKSSPMKAPKKLGFMSEPIYAYSPEAVDAAFESPSNHSNDEEDQEEEEINEYNSKDFHNYPGHREKLHERYETSSSKRNSEWEDEDDDSY